ncbi:MAG: hypothetical protein IPJ43_11655 [Saprospiraceae bacterium]|nr:hypothetical protein [Saprospiraceae bacterium]
MKKLFIVLFILFVKNLSVSQDSEFELINTVPGFNCTDGIYSKKHKEIIIINGHSKVFYSDNFTKSWHEVLFQKFESQSKNEIEDFEFENHISNIAPKKFMN